VSEHAEAAHLAAAAELRRLMGDSGTADRCRATAQRLFSLDEVGVPRYRELYGAVSRSRSNAGS
jgi:hypothetical protein